MFVYVRQGRQWQAIGSVEEVDPATIEVLLLERRAPYADLRAGRGAAECAEIRFSSQARTGEEILGQARGTPFSKCRRATLANPGLSSSRC